MSYYKGNLNNMRTKFFDSFLPSWDPGEMTDTMAPLFISKNPNSAIANLAISEILTNCSGTGLNLPNLNQKCDPGYIWDKAGSSCFKVLDGKLNFWQAAEACTADGAHLIEFGNDLEVHGLVQLLQSGK